MPVRATVVPGLPLIGRIDVIEGDPVTVKPKNAVDAPIGVITVTVRSPSAAPGATVTVIGRVVAVPPFPIAAVTPVPLNRTVVAPVRFVPVIVPLRAAPGVNELGAIAEIVMGFTIVNPLNGADMAAEVVIVTVCGPSLAWGVSVITMGRDVAVPPLPMLADTPDPLNVTEVAPDRPDPVITAPMSPPP